MKLALSLLVALVAIPAHARDSFVSARCQAALLKVTTEALDREFISAASQFEYIGEVTLNYGMKGMPRAVFFGTKKGEPERRCLVQVYTKPNGSDPATGCPNYEFDFIDSNCR